MLFENIINLFFILFIFMTTFITILALLFFSNKNYEILEQKPLHILFITIFIKILCISLILEIMLNDKIHHLIYFNLRAISVLPVISIYIDRNIVIYIRKNNKIKYIRCLIIMLTYIILIIILF